MDIAERNTLPEVNEGRSDSSPASSAAVSMEDMRSHGAIAARYSSPVQEGLLSSISIDIDRNNQLNRPIDRMPGLPGDRMPGYPRENYPNSEKPREISDKDYKDLANEIKQNGQIPQSLKDALERKNGNQIIDLDKLNELIKPMKLEIDRLPDGRRRLDLRDKDGNIVDSIKSRSGNDEERPNIKPQSQWWERYVPSPIDRLLPERKPN